VVRFKPPKYRDVRFAIPAKAMTIAARMKYIL